MSQRGHDDHPEQWCAKRRPEMISLAMDGFAWICIVFFVHISGGMPKLHPRHDGEGSRPAVAVRHARLQAHVSRIRLQSASLPSFTGFLSDRQCSSLFPGLDLELKPVLSNVI